MGKEEDDIFLEAMSRLEVGEEDHKGAVADDDDVFVEAMSRFEVGDDDAGALEDDDDVFLAAIDGLDTESVGSAHDEPEAPRTHDTGAVNSHRGLRRQIKQGHLQPEAWLDLHRMTRVQAEGAVRRFLQDSHREGRRLVGIICGQGLHSRGGAVLPEALDGWLKEDHADRVERTLVPPNKDGGQGARYVLLKRKRGPR